jgi:hypothetical protein
MGADEATRQDQNTLIGGFVWGVIQMPEGELKCCDSLMPPAAAIVLYINAALNCAQP